MELVGLLLLLPLETEDDVASGAEGVGNAVECEDAALLVVEDEGLLNVLGSSEGLLDKWSLRDGAREKSISCTGELGPS